MDQQAADFGGLHWDGGGSGRFQRMPRHLARKIQNFGIF
jgi:hypothetical protein